MNWRASLLGAAAAFAAFFAGVATVEAQTPGQSAGRLSNERTAAPARPLELVEKSGEIVFSVYSDFRPFSYRDEAGEPAGIDVDIAKAIAGEMGLTPKILIRQAGEKVDDDFRINLWKGDLEKVVADVMMHAPFDQALQVRNDLIVLCCIYYEEKLGVLVDSEKIESMANFARFTRRPIAVEVDTVSDFFLTGAFQGQLNPSIRRGRSFEQAADYLAAGEADALMGPVTQLEHAAGRIERDTHILFPAMPGIVRSKWPLGLAVKENSRDLVYPLDAAISTLIESGRMTEIFAAYGVEYDIPLR